MCFRTALPKKLTLKTKFCSYEGFLYFWGMAKNGNIHPTRIFKSPDELELAWKAYKDDLEIKAKEWVKVQYVGKDGDRKEDPMKLPYTMDGFEVFCYENYGTVEQYFKNKDGYYEDFVPICSHIKKEIRANQITGGLLGVYNPSITQRLNNLVDNKDITTGGEKINTQAPNVKVTIVKPIEEDDE